MNLPSAVSIVTEPTAEPVTLVEALEHCKIDHSFENDRMLAWIKAARLHIEASVGPIMPQTMDAFWPCFAAELDLPWGNVRAITEFGHTPSSNSETAWTVSGENLSLSGVITAHANTKRRPARITLAYGKSWPSDTLRTYDAVRARFTAGWASIDAVPQDIKQCVLLLVDDWRMNRADTAENISRNIQNGIAALTRKYRRIV